MLLGLNIILRISLSNVYVLKIHTYKLIATTSEVSHSSQVDENCTCDFPWSNIIEQFLFCLTCTLLHPEEYTLVNQASMDYIQSTMLWNIMAKILPITFQLQCLYWIVCVMSSRIHDRERHRKEEAQEKKEKERLVKELKIAGSLIVEANQPMTHKMSIIYTVI